MSILWPASNGISGGYISSSPSAAYVNKPVRHVAVLGSTGSIGRNALSVISASPDLRAVALGCGSNVELLARQADLFRPDFLAVSTEELAGGLRSILPAGYNPCVVWGQAGYAGLAALEGVDCVVSAQSGSAGLAATLAAALAAKVIALANKESLVMAGSLLRQICASTGAAILPVDSEHYAIFQCVAGAPEKEIRTLILTASGGPFLGKTADEMASMPAEAALRHPNWNMGPKISIDSSTLMNKGLEFIEAMHLFGVSPNKIGVLVHPQSIAHSFVQFADNSILGQLACPDMRLPIAACLHWPRRQTAFVAPLDLVKASPLTFLEPDMLAFPCLALAMEAAAYEGDAAWQASGINPACVALNCANEKAVEAFLEGRLEFQGIAAVVAKTLHGLAQKRLEPPIWPAGGRPAERAVEMASMLAELAKELTGGEI